MRFSLFALFGFISLISTAENGMDERQRAWTLMTFELHYCLTPGGCKFNDTSTNKVIFTMRQRFSNGTEGDERDLSRDYWSDVKCSTEWPQFTQGPSTWMKCTQPDPHWHSSDFNPQWKFVGEPLGKKFPFEGKKTIAVSVQYPRGERPKGRYGLNQVYLSNATFVIENGNSHRHDNQAFLGCGGATGEEDKQWCDWNNVLNLNVTTNLVSITDYAALGLGTAETNPSW